MVAADPLTPPVELDAISLLVPRLIRIADEPEMRAEAEFGETLAQPPNALSDPAGLRIAIRPFEGE